MSSSSASSGEGDFNRSLAACTSCVYSIAYMVELKPWLVASGVISSHHVAADIADWVIVASIACFAVTTGLTAFYRSHPHRFMPSVVKTMKAYLFAIMCGTFFFSLSKLIVLLIAAGFGGFIEIWWCGQLALFVFGAMPTAWSQGPARLRRGVSLQVAEAEVAKVMAGLNTIKVASGGTGNDLECGCSVACAICMGDWEPGDSVKVTPCNHAFHESCLSHWFVTSMCKWKMQSCAVCRRDLLYAPRDGGSTEPVPPLPEIAEGQEVVEEKDGDDLEVPAREAPTGEASADPGDGAPGLGVSPSSPVPTVIV